MAKLSHLDSEGRARMVDVTEKKTTERMAVARGEISMRAETLGLILDKQVEKGDVFSVARVAGIMGAKRTPDLIPMCHPLNITTVDLSLTPVEDPARVEIEARVRVSGQTGVEMEALTAVSVCALTIYDMCKAVDREERGEERDVYQKGITETVSEQDAVGSNLKSGQQDPSSKKSRRQIGFSRFRPVCCSLQTGCSFSFASLASWREKIC
jgi:cyclic pyranopterin monophosphate synthase